MIWVYADSLTRSVHPEVQVWINRRAFP